ncbi:bifunctional 3,4-dihydroxy-2-butanone-4-phosphate synthase/GTP cyclohydrolase II [Geodermatophilus sp. YIM 151500]|uniref:bifunctional 3,4-dihydroxy-2-butanone-4-phosphate synthase/GTP cyclohydrolase II n=1 Tax=Geodermatophilus sp. YIM 151500 TaxID=2984531 RepID=UPI0021E47B3D|nr:bifunctional 3,4-dihydroxy-2-butanone-4-phosphate synthase/GTP cyclohydrolase II [Geodermatophilus sp. YIM 151500]MCV2488883.1 bifunctional 3,4-dihydroxy-2-butanone-4-phosphate synthase/GTP cyclohydrolase II [Geodermatophilus sp. YIM 151500]
MPTAEVPGGARFDPVGLAVREIADGGMVLVVDDEDREDEGDLIMAAEHVTAADVAFLVRHTSGVLCVALPGERCDELDLPLMVADNTEQQRTAFTHTVDLAAGTTTGISAADRSATIRGLADASLTGGAFNRPGHVFPLRARDGGVLKRAGHTEAAVDLARLAGVTPAGVLCEVVNDDGTMARRPELLRFAAEHGLPIITIADLVEHRRRVDVLVERTGEARVPTPWGEFRCVSYRSVLDGTEHVAFTVGDVTGEEELLVRVHSECLTGDIFRSLRCDCGPQLESAMARVAAAGRGAVVYLRGHEGRGIGLGHKLRAYGLQDAGRDTVDANLDLGVPVDSREYGIGAQILADLGARRLRLLTNNPAKYGGLDGYGLEVVGREPLQTVPNPENLLYLRTKKRRLGHLLDGLDDLPLPVEGTRTDLHAAGGPDRASVLA